MMPELNTTLLLRHVMLNMALHKPEQSNLLARSMQHGTSTNKT
jgi:hypothetical protein